MTTPAASSDQVHRWLAVGWPLAILFHLGGNSTFLTEVARGRVDIIGVIQLVMAVLALLVIATRSPKLGVTLVMVHLLVTFIKAPWLGNHELILALAGLIVLFSAVTTDRRWLSTAAPALRWMILIAYGFIGFSKLNRGFLDPVASCAVVFGDEIAGWVGLAVSDYRATSVLAIASTVILELGIPVLLVVRRTRLLGVVVALLFHGVLALEPVGHVFDFSAVLFLLFLLFMPDEFQRRLSDIVDGNGGPVSSRLGRRGVVGVAVGLTVLHLVALGVGLPFWVVAYPAWLLVAGAVIVGVVRWVLQQRSAGRGLSGPRLGWRPAAVLVPILILTALNGVSPYLQVRSATAFNMYSNLETIGVPSNHLLVPTLPGFRSVELVSITSAPEDHPLADYVDGDEVPKENLRLWLQAQSQLADLGRDDLVVEGNDEVMIEAAARPAGARPQPLSALDPAEGGWRSLVAFKLGYRRPVDTTEPTRCLRTWGSVG